MPIHSEAELLTRTKIYGKNTKIQRDCLLIQARTTRECMCSVRRGHFGSRDKDGGYTLRSAIAVKPEQKLTLHANRTALSYVHVYTYISRTVELLHCENRDFRLSFAPVTLTLIQSSIIIIN